MCTHIDGNAGTKRSENRLEAEECFFFDFAGSPNPPFNPADLPPLPPGVSEATLRTLSTGLGATGLGASALESALGHMLPGGLGSKYH